MGQVLHGNARTTQAVRRSIQRSRLPEFKDQMVDRLVAFPPSMLASLHSAANHAVPLV